MNKKKTKQSSAQIAGNKKAFHDYFIEERFESGLALMGWEVKSLRANKVQLKEAYIILKHGEAYIVGCHISPLNTASTHIIVDPTRTRKLLLHRAELDKLLGAVDRKGYTVVPLNIYWKKGYAKLEIGLAKGKKDHDKRATIKEREWNIEKGRLLRQTYR